MTRAQAIAHLNEIAASLDHDPEAAHSEADKVLLDLAGTDVRAAYQRVVDACSWWASA